MDVVQKANFLNSLLMLRRKSRKLRIFAMKKRKNIMYNILKAKYISYTLISQMKKRKIWRLKRSGKFWEKEVPEFDENAFKENFGMTRESFNLLCTSLTNLRKLDTNMSAAIPLEKRVAVCLYALRSSSEYRTVANLFGIGRTSVGEMVLEFCDEVYLKLKAEYLNAYPPTQEKITEIVSGFNNLGFPQCYGAIDGCHIEVRPPKRDATDYYNFKGWYSIILFAAADYKCRFTYINVGATGRNNDSSIFENSMLKEMHEKLDIFKRNSLRINGVSIPILLIGDSAFRLSHVVLKPFPFVPNQNPDEQTFNYKLSKCRRVVENAFGQLKARFRKIGKGLEVRIENAHRIIQACCILHNFCIQRKDLPLSTWMQQSNSTTQPERRSVQGNRNPQGSAIRNALLTYFARDVVASDGIDAADGDGADAEGGDGADAEGGDGVGAEGGDGVVAEGGNDAEISHIGDVLGIATTIGGEGETGDSRPTGNADTLAGDGVEDSDESFILGL